ncbi:MAG: GHMP kinase, partial [Patescibacteria group bacterium]
RVISSAIDKYIYVAVSRPPLVRGVSARYSISELVEHPRDIKNNRIRAALIDSGITSNIDVSSFSDVPIKSGLGSSSSFSVALVKGLYLSKGAKIDRAENAERAAHLEINLVGEPIGKQDQYASAFGGFNIFQFNSDESVDVIPIRIDFRLRSEFCKHLILFFTGISRDAVSVLGEQVTKTDSNFEILKKMSDSVYVFRDKLLARDFNGLGGMLHDGWILKKGLASKVSNSIIDEFYEAGLVAGAWGGKLLGAGGGGCILFMAPPAKKSALRLALADVAQKKNQQAFAENPFNFGQTGADTLLNHN